MELIAGETIRILTKNGYKNYVVNKVREEGKLVTVPNRGGVITNQVKLVKTLELVD